MVDGMQIVLTLIFITVYLNYSVRTSRFPPRQLETVGLDTEYLDIPGAGGCSLICHHHHNGVRSLTLWVDHSDGYQILSVHSQACDGLTGGPWVADLDLLGLSGTGVTWPVCDHVT